MPNSSSDGRSVPVDRYPGPVCHYDVADDTPVVASTDPTFERQVGTVERGTAVPDALASLTRSIDAEDLSRALREGDSFTVTVGADETDASVRQYSVQSIPPDTDEGGVLLFSEQKNEAMLGVDHVASVVSHDLRNPLDVAEARLRAARELDEEEHLDHVAQAHERMERIIQDVLTLARGEDVVDPDEPVDLGAVAEQAWQTVETEDATLTLDDSLPTAVADPDRVGRLFENLFRNCVEHGSTSSRPAADDSVEHGADGDTDTGVDVTAGQLEDGEGFFVADDGPGIPPEERERVFEPGYSSDDHGTGLGLAIVHRIADLHGWSAAVTESETGGTSVEFRGVDPVE